MTGRPIRAHCGVIHGTREGIWSRPGTGSLSGGRLTERLGSAFDGLALEPGRELTVLVGEIRDQAHLYGVLDRVRNLGLELVSVAEDPAA